MKKYRQRIYYTEADKALMWDRWQKGESLHTIARLFDRYHTSVQRILAETGGIRPPPRKRSRLALTLSEREEISRGIVAGYSIRSIAITLGRSPSTVNRELRNSALSRRKFAEFLAKQRPGLVAFEAGATAHYWARTAQRLGHDVKIIPAKAVAPFRQGHKTDENDALAVAEAARRPNVKLAPLKTVEQQGMQAIQRSRELLVHERVALSNHLRGLLLEFGIVIPQGFASLYRQLPEILEDGENELPDLYRPTLNLLYGRLCDLREDIERLNDTIEELVQQHPICRRLTALEGIGPIGSVLLYATLGKRPRTDGCGPSSSAAASARPR